MSAPSLPGNCPASVDFPAAQAAAIPFRTKRCALPLAVRGRPSIVQIRSGQNGGADVVVDHGERMFTPFTPSLHYAH